MFKLAFPVFILMAFYLLSGCDQTTSKTDGIRKPPSTIVIAAASDLKYALDSIVGAFTTVHPEMNISVTYGSSGKFYQQIIRDAPFDMYFSADESYTFKLDSLGLCARKPSIYGVGRLAIYSRRLDTGKGISMLLEPSIRKIAIANPAHAPYGKRAEEALRYYQLYEKLKPKLIMGENIAQAAQYVSSGAAEVGIVARSLAIEMQRRQQGNYFLVPEESHTPLKQAFVVLKHAGQKVPVLSFSDYISSPEATEIFRSYGFSTWE
jgi:molybdate transport system substrate-binding protein